MIPDEAVEAAAKRAYLDSAVGRRTCEAWEGLDPLEQATYRLYATDILTAAAPFIAAQALGALIEEAESRHGSSMYCKVTTYELRKALGQDVSDWPKRSEA